jgi:hypothetical protein
MSSDAPYRRPPSRASMVVQLEANVFKILPLQPTLGIDGNLQQIVHLPSPELERWEGVQSENALQHLEADGQWQPLLM